jgi:uncharacterized membrane protein YozB (DUF420 family)
LHDLPFINAILNGTSAILLVTGYLCIRNKKVKPHAVMMLSALTSSTAFLICYVIYHLNFPPRSIGLPSGALRTGYLVMLATHVTLAIVMLPMIGVTLWHAAHRQFHRHLKIARPTFWVWLYVSVTGVVIYIVLYHVYPTRA